MDIHARIQEFLQQQTIHPLGDVSGSGDALVKAGILPFIRRGSELSYYFMKPVAKNPHLDPPKFQICKGTRMYKLSNGRWRDIREGGTGEDREYLAATALREGVEEIGLKLQDIRQLFDAGTYGFSSTSTGRMKEMRLFAAEMEKGDFSDDVANTTADRAWLTLTEFDIAGREDHRYILRDIEEKLESYYRLR